VPLGMIVLFYGPFLILFEPIELRIGFVAGFAVMIALFGIQSRKVFRLAVAATRFRSYSADRVVVHADAGAVRWDGLPTVAQRCQATFDSLTAWFGRPLAARPA